MTDGDDAFDPVPPPERRSEGARGGHLRPGFRLAYHRCPDRGVRGGLRSFVGANEAVAVNSATAALHLALEASA